MKQKEVSIFRKFKLKSTKSRDFTSSIEPLHTHQKEHSYNLYINSIEFLIFGPKFFCQIINTSFFSLHKKSNPIHRVYKFQLTLMKIPNQEILQAALILSTRIRKSTATIYTSTALSF